MLSKQIVSILGFGLLGPSLIACQTPDRNISSKPRSTVYHVIKGPVEFVGFIPLRNVAESAVTLAPRVAEKRGVPGRAEETLLAPGDVIESGIVRSTGGQFGLMGPGEQVTIFHDREAAVVIAPDDEAYGSAASGIDCAECTKIAGDTCTGGVKKVTCGADGSCSFQCFPVATE